MRVQDFRTKILLSAAVLALGAFALPPIERARAAGADTVESHVANATAAAHDDLKGMLGQCSPRQGPGGPPPQPANNTAEPAKIFDTLYFVGLPSVSAWAVTTSDGIIVLDSLDNAKEAETFIEGGLKKLGLDPTQIKYVIITHAHGDHYGGAAYLQQKFHAKIVMSDTDWKVLEGPPRANYPAYWGPVPKRDVTVKDGGKITLGDTSIDIYQTPPHTPGTISLLVPIKDGTARHVAAEWGGAGFNFPQTAENFTTFVNSTEKFRKVVRERNADVFLANHNNFDNAFQKIAAMKAHPGGPNPFVTGRDTVERFLTVGAECAMAGRARLQTAAAKP